MIRKNLIYFCGADREGGAPIDAAPDSPAVQALTAIARRLLEPPRNASGQEA